MNFPIWTDRMVMKIRCLLSFLVILVALPTYTRAQELLKIPSCPATGQLTLTSTSKYIVNQKTYRDCEVTIQEGATIEIHPLGQLSFARKVTFPTIATSTKKIFHIVTIPNEVVPWWTTPVVFLKQQTLIPEWFGAVRCAPTAAACPDSTLAFQVAANSLMGGKKRTLATIQTNGIALDDQLGGIITTSSVHSSPSAPPFYNIQKNITISRDHITIDLKNHALQRLGSTTVRFVCTGDVNRSLDSADSSFRDDGYLQHVYHNDVPNAEAKRRSNGLFGCTIKNIQFGLPPAGSTDPFKSENVAGIALMRWVTEGRVENVTRYGKGTGGIILAACDNCLIKGVRIYGASEGRFELIKSPPTSVNYTKYYWSRPNIGILLHLSNNTKIDDVKIGKGPFFAGLQIKGGSGNEVLNSDIEDLRDPRTSLYCDKQTSGYCGEVINILEKDRKCTTDLCLCSYNETTKRCEMPMFERVTNASGIEQGKAPDQTPIPIDYGSRTAFWSRGDSPYQTPTGNLSTLTWSYPWSTKSFREADQRRRTYDTTWSNLKVLNSPNYVAYSFEESRKALFDKIHAENVRIGLLLSRTFPSSQGGEGEVSVSNMTLNMHNSSAPLSSIFPILLKFSDAELLKADEDKDLSSYVRFLSPTSIVDYRQATLPGRKECVGYYPYSLLRLVNMTPSSPVQLLSNASLLQCRSSGLREEY